jgi:hypothetical protein
MCTHFSPLFLLTLSLPPSQKKAPIRFSVACATVDPQTSSFDPSPLIPYMKALGVPYHYLSHPIIAQAKVPLPSLPPSLPPSFPSFPPSLLLVPSLAGWGDAFPLFDSLLWNVLEELQRSRRARGVADSHGSTTHGHCTKRPNA